MPRLLALRFDGFHAAIFHATIRCAASAFRASPRYIYERFHHKCLLRCFAMLLPYADAADVTHSRLMPSAIIDMPYMPPPALCLRQMLCYAPF